MVFALAALIIGIVALVNVLQKDPGLSNLSVNAFTGTNLDSGYITVCSDGKHH